MVNIGSFNSLKVLRIGGGGYYLDGGENEGEIFLPKTDVHTEVKEGDEISVFLTRNAKRNAIATTMTPFVMPGNFGFLTVDSVSTYGALLDWGVSFPLFMPSREWKARLRVDETYLVYVYYDTETRQIIATMHTERYLNLTTPSYKMNQEVELLIAAEHESGYKVIVDNAYWGMIYSSEIFEYVEIGMKTKGYVKYVREDGKVDVSLQKQGISVVNTLDDLILSSLEKKGGFLPFNDKSDPDEIADNFGCSKKAFKKCIGVLYKHRRIQIEEDGIRLISTKEPVAPKDDSQESQKNNEESGE
jgi:predicted RNA-binding protein (virulence factor B family)